jgi:hypothetical protein
MRSAVNRFGIDQGVFTTDREWMGNGWDLRQPQRRSRVLSRSYPCDPWLIGSESIKAFFNHGWGVNGEWMGFETRGLGGVNPDRIRVIRGENGRKSAHGTHGKHGRQTQNF